MYARALGALERYPSEERTALGTALVAAVSRSLTVFGQQVSGEQLSQRRFAKCGYNILWLRRKMKGNGGADETDLRAKRPN